MSHVDARISSAESLPGLDSVSARARVSRILSGTIFFSVLALIVITAIPYGTVEAWWKAFFVCAVFVLAILWLIESYLSEQLFGDAWPIVLPLAALALFSFLQTVSFQAGSPPAGIGLSTWNAISVDPYQTRFFVLQLLALVLAGVFISRYANSERRVMVLVNVVICIAVASAIFGIVRQTTQHEVGFGLPLIRPDQGFAQFVNKNHFAYLMEMAFGLALGIILAGGVKRERVLVYVAALLPIWTALVLCGSRGGLLAMLTQVVIALLLFGTLLQREHTVGRESKILGLAQSLPARVLLLVVLISGISFGALWLGGDPLATRLGESRRDLSAEMDAARQGVSRKQIWRVTLNMFAANPIAGVGMGAYWAAVPLFHDASGQKTPQEAHNDYLELLASGGVIAAALAVWFGVVVFRRTKENLTSSDGFRRAMCFGAAVGIAGVAIHSLFEFGLHLIINALVFTTLVAITTSKTPWSRRQTSEVP